MRFDLFNSVRAAAGQPCTLEKYLQLVSDPRLARLAAEISACDDKEQRQKLKKQLPVICWQASFGGKRRTNANAVPSGLYMADYDDVADVQGLMEAALERREELGIVYIGRSISGKGVRIVAECRPEFSSIAECQHALSTALGQECDEACKDWARASYAVPAAYEFYIDQGLFEREARVVYDPEEVMKSRSQEVKTNALGGAENGLALSGEGLAEGERLAVSGERSAEGVQTEFRGVPLKEIAEEWLKQNGGTPQEGERNAQLFKLATRMRYITDFNPVVIAANIPHCGLSDEEVAALCRSACQTQRAVEMPWDLRGVLERLALSVERLAENGLALSGERLAGGERLALSGEGLADAGLADAGLAAEALPMPPLPPVFKQYCDIAPEDFKQASVLCLLPILGTLASRLRARYVSKKMETPSFMVALEAPQASGKSFIEEMSQRCLAPMLKMDKEQRVMERMYEEEDKRMRLGTTKSERENHRKELEVREVPIIRKLPATASITKLLMRMENAQGLHLFALAVEIDTVHKAFKRGFSNLSDLLRCAFDNSEYGQDYATDTSYSGNLPIFYNTLYSGTPKAMRRFYPDCEDGTMSRTLFVTLPDQFGKPMPVWGEMSEPAAALMEKHIQRLYEVSIKGSEVQEEHEMELEFLNEGLTEWMEKQRLQTIASQDRTRNTFYRRCAEVGFRAGMLAYYLWEEKNSAKVRQNTCKFAIWVAEKMLQQFVVRVKLDDDLGNSFWGSSLLNELPATFSREELERKMVEYNFQSAPRRLLSFWKQKGLIESNQKYGATVFVKSKCPLSVVRC